MLQLILSTPPNGRLARRLGDTSFDWSSICRFFRQLKQLFKKAPWRTKTNILGKYNLVQTFWGILQQESASKKPYNDDNNNDNNNNNNNNNNDNNNNDNNNNNNIEYRIKIKNFITLTVQFLEQWCTTTR